MLNKTRSLAPDLARGFMLLLIALAHAPAFVGDWSGPAWLAFTKSLIADNQARDMFIFLFGYGLGQLAHSRRAKGLEWISTRKLMRRRAWWLIAIGLLNTALLVPFDIIAVYGLTLLALAPMVRARDSVLWWTAGLTLIPATLLLAWQSVIAQAGPVTMTSFMAGTFGEHVIGNLPTWPGNALAGTIMVVPGMLAGIWAARRRLLDEPERHLPLLRRLAYGGLALALIGRLPAALLAAGAFPLPATPLRWAIAVGHDLTGYAGGVGMAAAIGLIAVRIHRRGPLTTALTALGQRSLSFYLFQAVVWVVLFYPFGLGLHDDLSFAATFVIAVAVWVVSLLLAWLMHAAGYRGPGEVLLRKLADRPETPVSSQVEAPARLSP
ncbi:DUF418 domain-containing protein [Nonomuraea sp. NPDC050310]|uniref:DUF418 domain-containing protein n=1 Tax=Nonomuraea sp. NPDC050310 TaxID=3154935 RepID=UPI0033CA9D11